MVIITQAASAETNLEYWGTNYKTLVNSPTQMPRTQFLPHFIKYASKECPYE